MAARWRELARSHAVGFLGRGMLRPVSSADDLDDDRDEYEESWCEPAVRPCPAHSVVARALAGTRSRLVFG